MNAFIKPSFYSTTTRLLSTSVWPLIIAAIVLILIGIGLRDPWPADEPRFALVAKEMVETEQWFFPARAQELYPDKPPIFMWAIALFYWITGSIRVSFLLPSALSGLLTIFLVYDITKRLWNKKTGLVAGWLLLFSLQFMLQAKTAQIDAMVCAWITLACYGLLRYCLVDGGFKWYALAWFFMGIGVITKGVGFLPLLMLLPYIAYRLFKASPEAIVHKPMWTWFTGPLFMLFAISLWFVPMLLLVAQSDNLFFEIYRDNILFKQTVTRYADSWHHVKPFWYYITSVIPIFWLPSILALPWLLKPWINSVKNLDPRIILPLGFVVLVILFFSMSPGKRGVYVLPALPMFIIAVAPYFELLKSKAVLRNIALTLSLVVSVGLITFAVLGHFEVQNIADMANKLELDPWLFFFMVGVISLWGILMLHGHQRWAAWPVLMSTLWIFYSTYGYALRNEISTPLSVYENVQQYIEAANIDTPEIALIKFSEQFILFAPYPIVHFGYHSLLEEQLSSVYAWHSTGNQFVLIEDKLLEGSCYDIARTIDLGYAHRRHWLLVPLDAKKDDCAIDAESLPLYRYQLPD
jgi:hypothetical protein